MSRPSTVQHGWGCCPGNRKLPLTLVEEYEMDPITKWQTYVRVCVCQHQGPDPLELPVEKTAALTTTDYVQRGLSADLQWRCDVSDGITWSRHARCSGSTGCCGGVFGGTCDRG